GGGSPGSVAPLQFQPRRQHQARHRPPRGREDRREGAEDPRPRRRDPEQVQMTADGAADQPKRLKFAKACALAILASSWMLGPILEAAVTGRIEEYGNLAVAETFLSIAPIYWWYYVDKQERQFRAGPLLNVGVIALAAIALPVYFIRSRGWKRGGIA